VEGVSGQLGGVALRWGEAADGGVDGVDVDQRSLQHGLPIDHLGDCGRGSARGTTTLCVEGD